MALIVKVIPIKAEVFDSAKVMANIEKALDNSGKRMETGFSETIKLWTDIKPKMKHEVEMGGNEASVWAGPTGTEDEVKKWDMLDNGVPYPHPILPKASGGYLKFPFQGVGESYIPSTTPRQFSSTRRQKLGPYVYRRSVWHPGFEAREWSLTMADQEVPILTKDVQEAIDEGLK
jgi:hypothetical protein